jgi:hypothetical protein
MLQDSFFATVFIVIQHCGRRSRSFGWCGRRLVGDLRAKDYARSATRVVLRAYGVAVPSGTSRHGYGRGSGSEGSSD